MTIRRASVILPCHSWDDFPTHLGEEAAAELLAAWTALWHPAILSATEQLPAWHQADEPPDPESLAGELVLVPPPSRVRMPGDWSERLRATSPKNPSPVETGASRADTIAAAILAAGLDTGLVAPDLAADFLALGYAYLQVERLTRAMRYSTVLDGERFREATIAAATAATNGSPDTARDELHRAFDLLSDARTHVYSVDFYVIDLTLVAGSTLGQALAAKLASRAPTSVLISGEQIERMAHEHPSSLAELKNAISAETASLVGGFLRAGDNESPEAVLENLLKGQEVAQRYLDRQYGVFGQFTSDFTPLLPEVLRGLGFRGALHASFDGNALPRADQRKTNWGSDIQASVQAISTTPLDASRAETWLKFAERIADTLAQDHVATLVLASWPGAECEYFDDLRRAAKYGVVLGKLVTLDEYFRATREPDDWTIFYPREYPAQLATEPPKNSISSRVDAYRADLCVPHRKLAGGLAAIAGATLKDDQPEEGCEDDQSSAREEPSAVLVSLNPWNFECSQLLNVSPLASDASPLGEPERRPALLSNVLGCGYAAIASSLTTSPVPLAEDLTLRNERLELVVSRKTGGIQSLRMHRDRGTRVSQRLVFHQVNATQTVESQMVADRVEISRNDPLVAEITSTGRVVDEKKTVLARYTQRVRVVRGLGPVFVIVELDPQQALEGDLWKSYFASRLAWADDALAIRRGEQWTARETDRERITSCEFVEVDDVIGRVTCFPLGLPFHRRAAPNWLDTLLVVPGEARQRFQFAIGLDQVFPAAAAIAALCGCQPCLADLPGAQNSPRGWFLHVGAKNVLVTHAEPLAAPTAGVRLRLLETEGRETNTKLSAFRQLASARRTDFRGEQVEVLSVVDGRVEIDIGPHRWLQIEAEW